MDIIAIAVALKKAISQTKDIIASHFVAGTNIEITDNPDGTQTINASGKVSVTDEVARQAISDHEADVNNPHSVTKNQIGLGNVDNTSDADKPISTAAQTALNGKQPTISDLATIRSNATAGAGAAEVVTGIDETGNNYLEMKSGVREYLSSTAPTGDIPTDSVGMGFDEGIYTYKSGTRIGEGVPTANEFTGDISQFDNQGGTGNTYKYFKLTGDYTITLTCKDDCTSPTGITIGLNAEGGVATGGFTTLVAQRGNYTQGQIITGKTSDNGYQYVYIYGGSTTLEWIVEHFDIMLNKGNTALPYEPYGAKKFPFYANGQPLTDYIIYGATGGVGDEVTDSESAHYGEYDISVICGNTTTHIYLASPLGANDSIDYTTAQVDIPTVDGENTLICDTTVQPFKVSLTYTGWHSDLDDTTARIEALENAPAPSGGMIYDTLYEGTTASSYPYLLAHAITNYKFIIIAVGYSNVYTNTVIPVAVWSTVTSGGNNYDITVDTAQLRVNASEIVPRSANNRILYGVYGIK